MEILDLSKNQISNIKSDIDIIENFNFKNVRSLHLNNNNISDIK